MTDHAPLRITAEFLGGPLDGTVGVVTAEQVFHADASTIYLYALGEAFADGRAFPVMRYEDAFPIPGKAAG